MYTTNEYFYQKDGIYQGIYISPNLFETKYEYKNGKLILYYENVTENQSANGYRFVEMNMNNFNDVEVKETNETCSNLKPIIHNIERTKENIR